METELEQRLIAARDALDHQQRLERSLATRKNKLSSLKKTGQALQHDLEREGADVRRLEGLSFTNLMLTLFGDKKKALDREHDELAAAQLAFDEHGKRIDIAAAECNRVATELASLPSDLQERYQSVRDEKEAVLLSEDSDARRALLEIAEKIGAVKDELRELDEAIRAGYATTPALGAVAAQLDGASTWGALDIMGGGMLTTDPPPFPWTRF